MKFSFVLALAAVGEAAKIQKSAAGPSKALMVQKRQALQTREKSTAGQCVDMDTVETDAGGDGCDWYYGNEWGCGVFDDNDFWADTWCCACGGGF